jgi:hypothetical protein
MKHGRLASGMLVFALMALVVVPPEAWAALPLDEAANWQMDESSGPMIDTSANNNTGSPTDVRQTGSTYIFNGSTSRVAVPDNESLDDPGGKDIRLTASLKAADAPMDDDSYDIVRKGLHTTPGGDYKMEIERFRTDPTVGRLHCLFRGTGGLVQRVAKGDIIDGNWHTLECIKTSSSVVARVDGKSYTSAGSAGSISNQQGVMVGAKTAAPLEDVFDGSMDYVSIDIAP